VATAAPAKTEGVGRRGRDSRAIALADHHVPEAFRQAEFLRGGTALSPNTARRMGWTAQPTEGSSIVLRTSTAAGSTVNALQTGGLRGDRVSTWSRNASCSTSRKRRNAFRRSLDPQTDLVSLPPTLSAEMSGLE